MSFDGDATWAIFVASALDGAETGFINFGACFGNVEGVACGKSLQYEQFCYAAQCGKCATHGAKNACTETAGASASLCKPFKDQTAIDCPALAETAKQCGTVVDALKTLCGP